MKAKALSMVLLFLAAVLLAAFLPATSSAGSNKTYFHGTECYVAPPAPGTTSVLGNGWNRTTGMRAWGRDTMDDPRVTGDSVVVINFLLDPSTFSGPMWGTFELTNAQGSWSGHWTGRLENGASRIRASVQGAAGYAGLVSEWTLSRPNPSQECYDVSGYIVETGAGN